MYIQYNLQFLYIYIFILKTSVKVKKKKKKSNKECIKKKKTPLSVHKVTECCCVGAETAASQMFSSL